MKKIFFILIIFSTIKNNAQNGTYQVAETALPTFTNLATIVGIIGTNPATIHINKTITLNGNLTIPSNISLKFYNRAVINLNGKTLTINGPMDAGAFQIFNGKGVVNGLPKIDKAYPEWWKIETEDWTNAIQNAINFYPRVFFQSGDYKISKTINLSPFSNHIIIGNGESTNIISDMDNYLFYCGTTNGYPKNTAFENLTFHCKKGIKMNTENGDPNTLENIQILNIKIDRCYFHHNQGNGSYPDIAINLFEVFDSSIYENRINDFDIAIKLKGCDLNSIHDNRIQGFHLYGIADFSRPNGNQTGSQTSIIHNDILTFNGNQSTGAFIKSNNRHVIIRDNFLENNGSSINPLAYIDCSNVGLENNSTLSYSIDITGNRLSKGADFSYLINEEFKSLNLSDIPLSEEISQIPPSSFCKNLTNLELVKNMNIRFADRPKNINIFNVFSFREWGSFRTSNLFQNDINGCSIINPNNISDLGHDPDGHTATFNPKSIKLKKNTYIKIQISQKITGEINELNNLSKKLKIKIITRNTSSENFATINNDYYVTIKQNGENDNDAWAGHGNYICNNSSDTNFNNYTEYIVNPTIDFNSNSDYWLLLAPLNSDKEIRSIIIEPDYSICLSETKIKQEEKIIDIKDINELKVYPNPADNILNFDLGNNSSIKSLIIYDLNGRFIKDYTNEIINNSINVSALSAGNFIVKIVSENNTSKIILKK
jgi:hypothetical protein